MQVGQRCNAECGPTLWRKKKRSSLYFKVRIGRRRLFEELIFFPCPDLNFCYFTALIDGWESQEETVTSCPENFVMFVRFGMAISFYKFTNVFS